MPAVGVVAVGVVVVGVVVGGNQVSSPFEAVLVVYFTHSSEIKMNQSALHDKCID